MSAWICSTCGVQAAETGAPPAVCAICADERQYVGWEGQHWVTMEELCATHSNVVEEEEPGLVGIRTEAAFAIGQRALLVCGGAGNLLWDCISLLDRQSLEAVERLGGVDAICISHPHFLGSCVEWSRAFGGAPIWVHAFDSRWVARRAPEIHFWDGDEAEPVDGLSLVRLGGHFPGSSVLLWPQGAEGRGVLLSGDTVQVVPDRRWVSFMYSYPNLIPLPASEVGRIAARLATLRFDRIYGAWPGRCVRSEAQDVLARSARRYQKAAQGSGLQAGGEAPLRE